MHNVLAMQMDTRAHVDLDTVESIVNIISTNARPTHVCMAIALI